MDSHVNYVFVFISQFGGITEGDYIIVLYAHGMAALETGNPHVRHEQKIIILQDQFVYQYYGRCCLCKAVCYLLNQIHHTWTGYACFSLYKLEAKCFGKSVKRKYKRQY